jgi:site-specific DNA-cytosine methylase
LPTKYRGDPHEGTDTILFRKSNKARDAEGYEVWVPADYSNTLDSFGDTAGVVAFNIYPSSGQGARLEASPTTKSNTLDATALARSTERGTRVVGWPRRLTPTECERLQGFPDGWTEGGSETARYKQLGNAVTVPVAEWIGRRILRLDLERDEVI